MIRKFQPLLLVAGLLGCALAAHAAPIQLTPDNMVPGNQGPSNCEPACVETTFGTSGLDLLFKAEVGTSETPTRYSGSFGSSYTATFSNSVFDPADALIDWIGPMAISCEECYLAVKGGNQDTNYYFFDLSGWTGVDHIQLTGFWPRQGAISHVSIWGVATAVPEPGTLALLGLGLLGFGLVRRGMVSH